jgi:hypothetical protein
MLPPSCEIILSRNHCCRTLKKSEARSIRVPSYLLAYPSLENAKFANPIFLCEKNRLLISLQELGGMLAVSVEFIGDTELTVAAEWQQHDSEWQQQRQHHSVGGSVSIGSSGVADSA